MGVVYAPKEIENKDQLRTRTNKPSPGGGRNSGFYCVVNQYCLKRHSFDSGDVMHAVVSLAGDQCME